VMPSMTGAPAQARDIEAPAAPFQTVPRPAQGETALDFVLPAGQDLTHVRLHMSAAAEGATIRVDDVSLIELPPTDRASLTSQEYLTYAI